MMKRFTLILSMLVLMGIGMTVQAQLADGTIAPDFTVTDIDGNTHHLYEYLDEGKTVVIDFSATWCPPCWSYAQTGTLDDLYEERGPNGTDDVMVLFIEGDPSTTDADLNGTGSNTQGDWVSLVQYPIVDGLDGSNLANTYSIAYWPTLYTIAPNRLVTESGQVGIADYEAVIEANQAFIPSGANNAVVLSSPTPSATCGDLSPAFTIQNIGTSNLTSLEATLLYNGLPVEDVSWQGNAGLYEFFDIEFNTMTVVQDGELEILISNPNGAGDSELTYPAFSSDISVASYTEDNIVTVEITTDAYGDETYWELRDGAGDIVASGGNPNVGLDNINTGQFPPAAHPDMYENNTTYTEEVMLTGGDDCLTFHITDYYGDGLSVGGPGNYVIYDNNGNILHQDTEAFAVEAIKEFGSFPNGAPVLHTATISNDMLDADANFTATGSSDDMAATYYWYVDGMNIDGDMLDYAFTANGVYDVVLAVVGSNGITITSTVEVVVNTFAPSAMIQNSQLEGAATYSATGSSDTPGVTYEWTVDGMTFTGSDLDYVFTSNGMYDVVLTVSSPNGLSTTTTTQVEVTLIPPTAAIENSQVDENSVYTATGISSNDPNATFSWMVDGMMIEGADLSYTFTANGTYDVVLTVTGENGIETTTSTQVEVTTVPPNVTVSAGIETGEGVYDIIASSDNAEDTFQWVVTDLDGNETTIDGSDLNYVFEFNGTYTVVLNVTGPTGAVATETQEVTITSATTVGIEDLSNINAVKLYPVPAVNFVNLELTLNDAQTMKVTVSNVLGQTVATVNQEDFSQGTNLVQINTVDFANGLYFINVETAAQTATQRFVVGK